MKIALLGLLICLISCRSKTEFEYYSSPDRYNAVTVMKHQGRVYFTRGRYKEKAVPSSFIWPVSGIENAYLCYIHWCGPDGVEILSPYGGEWLDTEKDPLLRFRQITSDEHNSIMQGGSQEYVYCYGNIAP